MQVQSTPLLLITAYEVSEEGWAEAVIQGGNLDSVLNHSHKTNDC